MPPPGAGGGPANMGIGGALRTALRFGGAAFFLAIRLISFSLVYLCR
jgi:hypothetical protein